VEPEAELAAAPPLPPAAEPGTLIELLNSLCGPDFVLAISIAGLALFVASILVALLSRRGALPAAFLLLTSIPLVIGLWGTFAGLLRWHGSMQSGTEDVETAEMLVSLSASFLTALFGFFAGLPAFFVAALALLARSLGSPTPKDSPDD
jgi:hypothetical protein